MWLLRYWVGAVVLGDGAVHSEGDRSVLGRHRDGPQRTSMPGDGDLGAVDDLAHLSLLLPASSSVCPSLSELMVLVLSSLDPV